MRSVSSALLLAKRLRAAALVGDQMRSVSSALLLAKRLRAAALVGDRYAVRFLGAAACEAAARSCAGRRPVCGPFPRRCCLRSGSSIWKLAGAARYLDFRPASGRGERRKTLREA
jgi:predicted deacylase